MPQPRTARSRNSTTSTHGSCGGAVDDGLAVDAASRPVGEAQPHAHVVAGQVHPARASRRRCWPRSGPRPARRRPGEAGSARSRCPPGDLAPTVPGRSGGAGSAVASIATEDPVHLRRFLRCEPVDDLDQERAGRSQDAARSSACGVTPAARSARRAPARGDDHGREPAMRRDQRDLPGAQRPGQDPQRPQRDDRGRRRSRSSGRRRPRPPGPSSAPRRSRRRPRPR